MRCKFKITRGMDDYCIGNGSSKEEAFYDALGQIMHRLSNLEYDEAYFAGIDAGDGQHFFRENTIAVMEKIRGKKS